MLASRLIDLHESSTIAVLDRVGVLEKGGEKIVKLSVGEPSFNTPEFIKAAAIDALMNNETRYSNSRGIIELRRALCEYYNKKYAISLDPAKNILITPGGKQAIFYNVLALVQEGDEVLIPAPAWGSFAEIVKMAGGIPIEVACRKEDNFAVSTALIQKFITPKTKLLIINSPNNPTGKIIPAETFKALYKLCVDNEVLMLSDEIYDCIVFKEFDHFSLLSIADSLQHGAVVNGFSKLYAMTGWRLGYIIADEMVIDAMLKIQQNSATCPVTFVQKGGLAALLKDTDNFPQQSLRIYQENRDYLVDAFSSMKNFSLIAPDGGFYALIDVAKVSKDATEFSMLLLNTYKIAVVPGAAFGESCMGFIRVSFATNRQDLVYFVKVLKENFE